LRAVTTINLFNMGLPASGLCSAAGHGAVSGDRWGRRCYWPACGHRWRCCWQRWNWVAVFHPGDRWMHMLIGALGITLAMLDPALGPWMRVYLDAFRSEAVELLPAASWRLPQFCKPAARDSVRSRVTANWTRVLVSAPRKRWYAAARSSGLGELPSRVVDKGHSTQNELGRKFHRTPVAFGKTCSLEE
jgi:hypothetical protein